MRVGSHLLRRGRTYFFRCRLPRALAKRIGRAELVRTLGTRKPAVARAWAAGVALGLERLWARLWVTVSSEDIAQAIDAWFEEETARAFRIFRNPSFAEALIPDGSSREGALAIIQDTVRQDAELRIDQLGDEFRAGDFSFGRPGAGDVIARLSEPVDDDDQTFAIICKAVMKALGQLEEGRLRWAAGEVEHHPCRDPDLRTAPSLDAGPLAAASMTAEEGPALRERIDTYLALKEGEGRMNQKQMNQLTSELGLMARIFGGETSIGAVTKRRAGQILEGLRSLPPHYAEHAELRGLEFEEMVARARELSLPRLSARPINGYLSSMSGFFNNEKMIGNVTENPFAGMHVKTAHRGESDRGFTKSELSLIFSNPMFMGSKSLSRPYDPGDVLISNWKFWSTLIALFTGARVSEIAQLRPNDVHQEEDVWVFDINARDNKRLKNPGSARLTPIHSELLRIGVVRLAEVQKARGHVKLLPEAPQSVGGDPGKQLSKWMSEKFLVRLGIERAGGGFHSFRHSLRTMMREARIDLEVMNRIEGHTTPGHGPTYGKHSRKAHADALESVTFPPEVARIPARPCD